MDFKKLAFTPDISSKFESVLMGYLRRCYENSPHSFDKFYSCMKGMEEPINRLGMVEPFVGMRYQQCIESEKETRTCMEQSQAEFNAEVEKTLRALK